jgi:hypothetical protein
MGNGCRYTRVKRSIHLQRVFLPGQNKSGAMGAAKNPVWQEEESPGVIPVPDNLQGKSTQVLNRSVKRLASIDISAKY